MVVALRSLPRLCHSPRSLAAAALPRALARALPAELAALLLLSCCTRSRGDSDRSLQTVDNGVAGAMVEGPGAILIVIVVIGLCVGCGGIAYAMCGMSSETKVNAAKKKAQAPPPWQPPEGVPAPAKPDVAIIKIYQAPARIQANDSGQPSVPDPVKCVEEEEPDEQQAETPGHQEKTTGDAQETAEDALGDQVVDAIDAQAKDTRSSTMSGRASGSSNLQVPGKQSKSAPLRSAAQKAKKGSSRSGAKSRAAP
mmetsp:Transcript_44119/g.124612  ORF Transcript_44119/g.124612 Transcript_44119/m.124612 type:complete len:254 (-) Transcript_44119:305-1066(-)